MSSHNPTNQLALNFTIKSEHEYDRDDDQLGLANEPQVPSFLGMPLKYLSLVTLAVQNSLLTIVMHYSRIRTPASQVYSAATAVLMNELLKGLISLAIAFTRLEHSGSGTPYGEYPQQSSYFATSAVRSILARFRKLGKEVFSPDCWKCSIPAILYVIQNNLQFVAVSNLDAATFQVTYQMKILTTAAFSVLLLRRKLAPMQWLALFVLALGVGIVQIQSGSGGQGGSHTGSQTHDMNPLKGFLAVAAACFTSGLAGVYIEMVLKNCQGDLWVRNAQLSLFSLLPALVPVLFSHHSGAIGGFGEFGWVRSLFDNFGAWAWATVAIQVFGGLVTSLVIKYSDNILKGFATSLSIILSFLASVVLFKFKMTWTFVLGSVVVLFATWLYNQPPKCSSSSGSGIIGNKDAYSLSSGKDGRLSPLRSPVFSAVSSMDNSARSSLSRSSSPGLDEKKVFKPQRGIMEA